METQVYRGKKVTVIGAITINKVLAVMTMDNSMDSNAFHVFVEKFLVPQLWTGQGSFIRENKKQYQLD